MSFFFFEYFLFKKIILFFVLLFYLFLSLAMLCGMWDHSSLIQGSNLCPLHWKWRVLTTGSPGKSQMIFFFLILDRESVLSWNVIVLVVYPCLNLSAYLLTEDVTVLFVCICQGFEHPSYNPLLLSSPRSLTGIWPHHRHLVHSHQPLVIRIKWTYFQLVNGLSYQVLQIFTLQHLLILTPHLFLFPTSLPV